MFFGALRFLDIRGKYRVVNLFRHGRNERGHNLVGATDKIGGAVLVALHCGTEVLIGNIHKLRVRGSFLQKLKERLTIIRLLNRIRNQLIRQGHYYILTSGIGVGIEIHGFKGHCVGMMIEPIIGADGVFCVQSIQFLFLYNVVSTLTHITSLPFRIGKVVCLFLSHALLHEIIHHFKDIHFLKGLFFGLYRHFRFTLFHNIGIMTVDVGNQLGGSAVDGFKTCTKLFQLLVFRPRCDIAKAIFACFNTIIGTNGKRYTFCLNFLCMTVF